MKYDAIIFDMDGLLLDSERIGYETFLVACRQFEIVIPNEVYFQCIGTNFPTTRKILGAGTEAGFPLERFLEFWMARYAEETFDKPVPLKAGVLELLDQTRDIPKAVATSTVHAKAQQKLENAGIIQYFRLIVGGDQVGNSKPHPEIYMQAAERLGVDCGSCLALEDSDNGVRSAHAAGMQVIQVPDQVAPSSDVMRLGHRVCLSLLEVGEVILA